MTHTRKPVMAGAIIAVAAIIGCAGASDDHDGSDQWEFAGRYEVTVFDDANGNEALVFVCDSVRYAAEDDSTPFVAYLMCADGVVVADSQVFVLEEVFVR